MLIKRNKQSAFEFDINPVYTSTKEDCLANISLLLANSHKNARVNVGGLGGGVFGNAGVNVGGLYGGVFGKLHNTIIGDVFPKITKYLPGFIKKISLPGLNIGMVTHTGDVKNSGILGLYNNIREGDGDYIAFGILNRVVKENGRVFYIPGLAGRFSLDGIFKHKKTEENKQGEK